MAQLTFDQRSLMKLILRSPDLGDGWRQCSDLLWPHVRRVYDQIPELFEVNDLQQIRISPEGTIALKWN